MKSECEEGKDNLEIEIVKKGQVVEISIDYETDGRMGMKEIRRFSNLDKFLSNGIINHEFKDTIGEKNGKVFFNLKILQRDRDLYSAKYSMEVDEEFEAIVEKADKFLETVKSIYDTVREMKEIKWRGSITLTRVC